MEGNLKKTKPLLLCLCVSVEGFRRSDSIGRSSSIQEIQLSHPLQSELPTEELNSSVPADTENDDSHTITGNAGDYCVLTARLTASREPQPYCELRLNDQSSDVYIDQHTEDLNTPMPADEAKNQDSQTAATGTDYCTLTGRTSTEQEPKLYYKLRLSNQPISDYINQQ